MLWADGASEKSYSLRPYETPAHFIRSHLRGFAVRPFVIFEACLRLMQSYLIAKGAFLHCHHRHTSFRLVQMALRYAYIVSSVLEGLDGRESSTWLWRVTNTALPRALLVATAVILFVKVQRTRTI